MATLTIRQLDDEIKEKLRVRAARHGRSMEAEAREIIAAAVIDRADGTEESLATIMHDLFAGLGWDGATLPSREITVRYADFDE